MEEGREEFGSLISYPGGFSDQGVAGHLERSKIPVPQAISTGIRQYKGQIEKLEEEAFVKIVSDQNLLAKIQKFTGIKIKTLFNYAQALVKINMPPAQSRETLTEKADRMADYLLDPGQPARKEALLKAYQGLEQSLISLGQSFGFIGQKLDQE